MPLPKLKKVRDVYLDHAATTYVIPAVAKAMAPYIETNYANPSSLYRLGRINNGAINDARRTIAQGLGTMPDTIVFTAGGTESDNLAIFGVAKANADRGKHIVSIGIEHHAVLHSLRELKKDGYEITFVPVDGEGIVKVEDIVAAIRPDTILITVMFANNEVGTIEPIADIGRAILKYRQTNKTIYPYFHSDACQAAGYLDLDVEKLHVDLLTINGGKIYGPKGVGALYIRRGVKIRPMIWGGGQERAMRSGTENISGIVGFAKAFELAQTSREKEWKRVLEIAKYLWERVQKEIPKVRLNGPPFGVNRLPNNVNITFMDVEGEAMLLYLDEYGIMASTGSACTSTSLEPSHVITGMGLPYEYAHGSMRFTFGKRNTKADVDYLMKVFPEIVRVLREISPVVLEEGKKHAKIHQR
ncbi:MAG: hypothetical protein A3J93_00220 [Candidatus Magasanikbacteria bacterium RIFOXYC2_FULL_42_28]|uniref:Aminotransferase class V domain-containing protein n=1 Tax=Candidatus Magasanikbacteria bacterium RIFOXYC2_FULL_42_28 TaxID=1798704 RepID=A0A1F6NWY5_9BACT|nr:MAG: hypothetical protein A3J93_00220 [Candidatus Magasanikbacteria bacterium RIFOXYC2_FULL_42_28]